MAVLSSARKAEIAKELRTAATWVAGPRHIKLLALANEIEGLDSDDATAQAEEDAAALADKGGPVTGTPDPDRAKTRKRGQQDTE